MAKFNHFCKVCNAGYNACDTCLNERNYAPWRAIACKEQHFQAYMVLHEYGSGLIEKDEAKRMLLDADVDGWESYPEHNKMVIAEIFGSEKVSADAVVETTTFEKPIVEKVASVVQTNPQRQQPYQKKPFDKFSKHK